MKQKMVLEMSGGGLAMEQTIDGNVVLTVTPIEK